MQNLNHSKSININLGYCLYVKILNKVSAHFIKPSPMFKMQEHPYMYVYYHFKLSELHNIDCSYLMSIATRLV